MNRHLIIGIPLLCLFLAAFLHEGKGQAELKFEDQLKAAPTASDSLPVIFNLIEAYRSTEPAKSIELAYLARNISSRLDDRQAYARSYTLLGHGYYEIGHYEKALENYSNALNRCIEKFDKHFVASCLSNIGKVYRELEIYELSINKFDAALKLYQALEHQKGVVSCLYELGVSYSKLKDVDQAMQYFNDVLDHSDDILSDKLRASTYKNIGNIFLERGETTMAKEFYSRAMNIFERLDDSKNIAGLHRKTALLYYTIRDYDKALDELTLAAQIYSDLKNRKRLAKAYLEMVDVYIALGYNNEAVEYINRSIAIGREYQLNEIIKDCYLALYNLYSNTDDAHTSLEYYLRYNAFKDSIFNQGIANTIARTETRNTFLQYEINIDQIDTEKQVQEYTRWFALILTILAILIVVLAFSRLISQRKANRVLAHQRNILKDTLEKLQMNEEKYKALFSQANDAIFIMDRETFTDCNDKTLEIFECKREDIVGQPPYKFSPKTQPDGLKSKEKALEFIKECYRGRPQRFYWVHTKQDGTAFDAEVSLNIITLATGKYIQAIVRDISDRVSAEKEMVDAREKAEKATVSKTFFLAKMSHEIRTMLGGITSASQLLKNTKVNKQQAELVDIINTSADNLLGIANEILDMSKIEAGKVELENRAFDFKQCLKNTVNTYLPKAKNKKISLYLSLHPRTPSLISGDELRLKQILNNLLSNAIKFTHKGNVRVEAELVKEYSESYLLGLKVTDTGIGIPENKSKDMFTEYSQLDVSISRRYGGTGLGLNIVYKLVNLLKGTIEVNSELDKGTQFIINLPFMKADEKLKDEEKLEPKLLKHKKYRILLAEDNIVNQKITLINLKNIGHDVDLAEDGNEAWEKYLENNYDIILMDIQMPGMDGIEVTRMIRKHEQENPVIKRSRIIALTANILSQDADYCLSEGMDAYVGKPFRVEDIIEKLDAEDDQV